MKWLNIAVARIRALVFGQSVEREIDEELQSHIEIAAEWHLARGLSPDEARREATRSFGSVVRIKERAHEVRGGGLIEELLQDLKYALRMLKKYPGLTVTVVMTLALGVGANTAIFSIVNAVLLRSLPFPEPDRLVRIFFNNPGTGLHGVRFSVPELDDLRDRAGVFEHVSAACRGSIDLTDGSEPQRLEMLTASPSYFSWVGATPQIGRLFGPEEFTPGYAPAVVISDSFWHRNFAADPNVLGRAIHLDNDPYTIVGVLPPGFHHPGRASSR